MSISLNIPAALQRFVPNLASSEGFTFPLALALICLGQYNCANSLPVRYIFFNLQCNKTYAYLLSTAKT